MHKDTVGLIALALSGIVLLILVAQNLTPTRVQILFVDLEMPLALLLICTAILGYIIGLFSAGIMRRRKRPGKTPAR